MKIQNIKKQKKLLILYTTLPNKKIAQKLAKDLIKKNLAACVNIIPGVESYYQWENKVSVDHEFILWIKTRATFAAQVEEFLTKNHPYQIPMICQIKPKKVSDKYLKWALGVTSHQKARSTSKANLINR